MRPSPELISTQQQPRRLIFRLSSMGDVILATAALSADARTDWVVAREFAVLLKGHPGIGKVWEFDRASGLRGWLDLCRRLRAERYATVWDLHSSLRTRMAWLYLWVRARGDERPVEWRRFPKQRWKLWGLFAWKRLWPLTLRPRPFVERFAEFGGGAGKPDLRHLLEGDVVASPLREAGFPAPESYYCVMPGSRWEGKRWPAAKYLEAIRRISALSSEVPVILGGKGDPESFELARLLEQAGVRHYSGAGRWDLKQVAGVLASSSGYLGNDTGLAHLAEALGVGAWVVYGPTDPAMGFGPWRKASGAVGLDLACRPCGKDGRRCYRLTDKYRCMHGLDAAVVAERFVARPARKTPQNGTRA